MPLTVVPRQGRDYKSIAEVTAGVRDNHDFNVADMSSRWNGKPVSVSDLQAAGETQVRVRYARKTKVTVVSLAP